MQKKCKIKGLLKNYSIIFMLNLTLFKHNTHYLWKYVKRNIAQYRNY